MLIDFKVNNFRSFKNEQDFSMETGKRLRAFRDSNTISLENRRVLKSSLIFGANANGKTNLLNALMMLKRLIMRPTMDELAKLSVDTFGYNKENTHFSIIFSQKGKEYNFVLEYNAHEIVTEILKVNKITIFNRERQNFKIIPDKLFPLRENVRKNQLFLYFAQQNNELNSKEAYSWFAEDLILVSTERIPNSKFKALQDNDFKDKFLHFLRAADFNIVDVEIRERKEKIPTQFIEKKLNSNEDDDDSEIEFVETVRYDVYSTHKSKDSSFQVYFGNESTGTKVFMFLALYVLSNSKKTLLIDEFDGSYHFELASALLSLINNNEQTNQFILTTHELSLMDNNLRQDQIWFAEKNRFGESELYSLFDFDDPALRRNDFKYKKRYLEGRYGATQIINKDLLLETLRNDS